MKKYELVYIVHPDLEDTVDKVIEKITGFITKKGGKITKEDNWGKRKLAYPIQKNDFGVYVILNFEAESKDVQSIEKNILLSEEIIRHLLVSEEEGIEEKKEASIKQKAKAEEKVKTKKKAVPRKEEKKADLELEVEEEKVEEKTLIKAEEKEEKDRLKELDEKLGELLGDD